WRRARTFQPPARNEVSPNDVVPFIIIADPATVQRASGDVVDASGGARFGRGVTRGPDNKPEFTPARRDGFLFRVPADHAACANLATILEPATGALRRGP